MFVREAVIEDAAGIARVDSESHLAAYSGLLPAEYLAGNTPEAGMERWRQILSGTAQPPPAVTLPARLFVAVDGDLIVGYCGTGPSGDADASGIGEVSSIYVAPNRWRKGIGRELMETALVWLRSEGSSEASLWVLEENRVARSFYEKEGWWFDGTRRFVERGGVETCDVRYRIRL